MLTLSRLARALGAVVLIVGALNACSGSHTAVPPLPGGNAILPSSTTRAAVRTAAGGTSPASGDVLAIDAGGTAVDGFVADEDFATNMAVWAYSTTKTIDTSLIPFPAAQAVYQTQRTGKTIVYTIPGLTPGSPYAVNLSFAELYWKAAGQRVFNVAINGTNVLTNFDIVATAGAPNKAVRESFTGIASAAGTIVISFNATTDNSVVNAIEIAAAASVAIDAGGAAAAGGFFADQFDINGAGTSVSTATGTVSTTGVTNPAPQAVYLTQRFGPVVTYTIPNFTPGSPYSVRLDFAETFFKAAGQRVFNIGVNGTQVMTGLDIYAAAGGSYKALAETFSTVASSTGTITIALTATTNLATISGIEINPGTAPTPAPSGTPAFNDWASYGYDAQRSGFNPNTTQITPASIPKLHLAWQTAIKGSTQAQPIVVTGVAGHAGLLIVANYSIEQAYDALTGKLVWSTTIPVQNVQACGVGGINGTAAYDAALGAIFIVGGTAGGSTPNHPQMYRLDAATGSITGQVDITPTLLPGEANKAHSGVTFANGRVYAGTGSDCEGSPTVPAYINWRGRVVAVDPASMTLLSTFYTTWQVGPNPGNYGGGGVWSWGGVSSDASGNVYVATGNAETNDATKPGVATSPFATTDNEQAGLAENLVKLSGDLSTVEGYNYPGFNFTIGLADLDYSGTPVVYQPPASEGCGPRTATQGKGGTLVINDTGSLTETASFALSIPNGHQYYSGNPAYSPNTGLLYAPITSAGAGSSLLPPGLAAINECGTSILWHAQFGQDAALFQGDNPRTAPIVTAGGVVFIGTPCTPNGSGGCGTPGVPQGALWAVDATTGAVLNGGQPLLVTGDALRIAPSADGLWLFLLDQSGNLYGLTVDPSVPTAAATRAVKVASPLRVFKN